MDQAAAIADMRFAFIRAGLRGNGRQSRTKAKNTLRSVKIDQILTGKYTAIPAFVGIMGLVFWLTFGVIGAWLSGLLDMGISALTELTDAGLTAYGINPVVHSLIINGIFEGVGSVLIVPADHRDAVLLPVNPGGQRLYGARCLCDGQAAAQDRTFRPQHCADADRLRLYGAGASWRAVPCQSERDRNMTILLTPFMSCSAKLPIYGFFTRGVFSRQKRRW